MFLNRLIVHNSERVGVERVGIGREGRETCNQPAPHSGKVLVLLVASCSDAINTSSSFDSECQWIPLFTIKLKHAEIHG